MSNIKQKWESFLELVKECDSITIVIDVPCENEELSFAKDFYMRAFYAAVKRKNHNCYIYNTERLNKEPCKCQ